VADVGESHVEEVDLIIPGANYGRDLREGSTGVEPAGGSVDPVFAYDHEGGVAVIGGFVYRGTALPQLSGRYVFGEFGRDNLLPGNRARLFHGDLATGAIQELRITPSGAQLSANTQLFSIGEDAAGELFVLVGDELNPNDELAGIDGALLRLVAAPPPGVPGLGPASLLILAALLAGGALIVRRASGGSLSRPFRAE
jgi:hypothetical protein